MIHHMVLLKIRPDVPKRKIDEVFRALAELKSKVPGLLSFAGGPYSSPEGLNKGYTHGFCMAFKDGTARDVYLPHPEHEKVKEAVLGILAGGIDGVVGFDFES